MRYTTNEIEAMRRKGEDRTYFAKLDAMSAAEIEAQRRARETGRLPSPKRLLTMRLDGDVIDWFKRQGRGCQTRMNAVLRRFIEAQKNPQR